jgi:hypothetical protein
MPAIRYTEATYHEHGRGAFVADNKPYGALLSLYLQHAPPPPRAKAKPIVHVRVFDAANKQIDAFDVPVHDGLNRFAWDLRTQPSPPPVQDRRSYYIFYPMIIAGPQVLPGTYTVQVDVPGASVRAPVTVQLDPHNTATVAELQAQYRALMDLAVMQSRVESDIKRLERIAPNLKRNSGLAARIDAELDKLRNAEPSGYRQPARLSEQIAYLRDTIDQYNGAPTQPQQDLIAQYKQEAAAADAEVTALIGELRK